MKLAREAFFGEDALVRCTVNGFRDLPALPLHELNELKRTMLQQFPKLWNSVQEFEVCGAPAVMPLVKQQKHLEQKELN